MFQKGFVKGFVLSLLLMAACHPEYLTEQEFRDYIADPDNGLKQEKHIKDIQVSVTYRPQDLLVAQELDGAVANAESLSQLQGKYKDYSYFVLSLSRDDKAVLYSMADGQDQFSQRLQILSFRMHDLVNLTTSQSDTIPVADYIFNRTFGKGTADNLLFVFSRESMEGREWVQFNLEEMGLGIGNHSFRFQMKQIDRTPKLRFTENS